MRLWYSHNASCTDGNRGTDTGADNDNDDDDDDDDDTCSDWYTLIDSLCMGASTTALPLAPPLLPLFKP
jgi:hypothetical protein